MFCRFERVALHDEHFNVAIVVASLTCGFNPDAWTSGYGPKRPNQDVRFVRLLQAKRTSA
jgi:hypothetical protein